MTKNGEIDKKGRHIMVAGKEGIQNRSVGPRKLQSEGSQQDLYESPSQLFRAYLNNKMTVILLMLQQQRHDPDSLGALKAVFFVEDIYHHLLRSEHQKQYSKVFKWLRMFFRRFPYVKPVQKRKAIEYIKRMYPLMGLKWRLEI